MSKLLCVLALLFSSAAFAAPGGEGGNTNCQGQGNPNSPCVPSTGSNPQIDNASRAAALALAAANATAVAAQHQSQVSTYTNGNINGNHSNSTSQGGNASAQGGTGTASAVGGNGSGNVTTFEAPRPVASTAYAAQLAASNGTCMGSSSAGIQTPGIGVSIGSTWSDAACSARYDAQALEAIGLREVAIARLCATPEIAVAMKAAGRACPKAE